MNAQDDSELKHKAYVARESRVFYLIGTWVLILWVGYRTFVMVSEDITRGLTVPEIVGGVIGGTIFDLRTVVLFVIVILLARDVNKRRSKREAK